MMSEPVQKAGMAMKWQWLVIAVFAFIFLAISSHWWLLYGRSVRGTVIDAANSQPLPDATVVVKWVGSLSGVHGPSYLCYHVALATTRQDGSFYVPFWWQQTISGANPSWLQGIWTMTMDEPLHVTSYEPGYFTSEPKYPFAVGDEIVVKMKPFVGTPSERIGQLLKLGHDIVCDADRVTKLPLLEAVYQEAKGLPKTKQDVKFVDDMLLEIESIQYGEHEALRRAKERDTERCNPETRTEIRNGIVSSWLICTGEDLVGEKR